MEVMRSSQEALLTIVEVRTWDDSPALTQRYRHKCFLAALLTFMLSIAFSCLSLFGVKQVLLYDPLFDWTMNPLKAFYLQHDEQQELNATLSSTIGGEDIDNHRKSR